MFEFFMLNWEIEFLPIFVISKLDVHQGLHQGRPVGFFVQLFIFALENDAFSAQGLRRVCFI